MEEEGKKKAKGWGKWVMYGLLSLLALLLLIVLLFPPLVSRYILRPMVEESFSQITDDAYHLKFDKLRWNLLKSHLFLDDIQINHKKDGLQNQRVEYLYLDTLIIKNIHYWRLLKGSVKIKSIDLKNLDIKMNLFSEQDSIQKLNTEGVDQSGHFSSFEVGDFNLDHLDLHINNDGDSLMNITKADFNIFNFHADSLNNPTYKGLPIFDELRFSAEGVLFKQENNKVRIKQVFISDNQISKLAELGFSEVLIEDLGTRNTQLFTDGSLSIDSIQWVDTTVMPFLKGKDFKIDIQSFQNTISNPRGQAVHEFIDALQSFIESSDFEFEFESLQFQLEQFKQEGPKIVFHIQEVNYQMKTPLMQDHIFSFDHYLLSTADAEIKPKLTDDYFTFKKFQFNEEVSTLNLEGFHYSGGHIGEGEFSFNHLILEEVKPLEILKEKELRIHTFRIEQPNISLETLQSNSGGLPWSIHIANIEVLDGDFKWEQKGWNILGMNIKVDSLQVPSDHQGLWEDVFKNIQLSTQSVDYQKSMDDTQAFVGNLQLDSKTKRLYFEQLDLSGILSDKRSHMMAKEVLLTGLNWKEIMNTSNHIVLDTLQWTSMEVDGTLSANSLQGEEDSKESIRIACQYLSLPNIDVHVELQSKKKGSQLLLEDLNVKGRDLGFNLEEEEFLQFEDLIFISGYTSFAQSLDSTLISTESWEMDMEKELFSAKDIHFQMMDHSPDIKSYTESYIDMDELYLTGLQPFLLYNDRQIDFDSIQLLKPRLNLVTKRSAKMEYEQQSHAFYDKTREWVRKFKSIGFNSLNLENLQLSINHQYLGRKSHIIVDDFNFLVDDFYVDYASFQTIDRFLFYDHLEMKMNGYSHSLNDGERLIHLNKAHISSLDNRLYFQGFRLLSLGDSIPMPINLEIQDILLKDLRFEISHSYPHLYLGGIFIDQPKIEVKESKLRAAQDDKFNLVDINLFPFIRNQLSSIEIEHIELNECVLQLPLTVKGLPQDFDFQHINFKAEGIFIDSNNIAFSENKFFYSDDLSLNIPQFSLMTPDRFYNIGFQNLSLSSRNRSIRFDSLSMQSRYDRKTFSAQLEYQKDQIDLLVPSLLMENIDYREAIFRNRFKAGVLTLNQAQLHIYKDKTIAPDTSLFRPMPAQLIKELDFYLNIDTLLVNDGFIKYEEFNHMMNQTGQIYFDQLDGMMTGISNDEDFRRFGGALKLDVKGRLMAEANVSLHALFPLNSPKQEFLVMASMEPLKATSLNPLIQPLTLLSAKEGRLEQMQMNVSGNEELAYGDMLLRYEDLKVEVLKKNLEESQLASFLANSILIKQNNNNFFGPRRGSIYYDRVKYRSFIHYLAHFAIIGAKTSIGIDQRKTARKIKRIEQD